MENFNDPDARHFFEVYGPFNLKVEGGKICKPTADWWRDVVDVYDGPTPERGIGCYMFTLGNAQIKPWYVGKTWCEGGFRDEAFTDHKLEHYNEALSGRKGPARIFFFPLITRHFHDPNWQLSRDRTSTRRLINWLEKTLIGMALSRNPDLQNARDTTLLRTVRVRGIIGKSPIGRPHGEVALARKALLGE
jgi:hypothetical protein